MAGKIPHRNTETGKMEQIPAEASFIDTIIEGVTHPGQDLEATRRRYKGAMGSIKGFDKPTAMPIDEK